MASSSHALAKRSSDSALMPPPPPPKRLKRPSQVLDEDVYASALSHIVARDFFPGLLETEAQEEYLSALESRNNVWIREAGRKLTEVMTPGPETRRRGTGTSFPSGRSAVGDTPIGHRGDTAGKTPGPDNADFAEEKTPAVDVNMSLGAFQAKYTSEDNESFNELLDQQNMGRAAKYAYFHRGNKIPTSRQIAYREDRQRRIEAGERQSTALVVRNGAGEERQLLAPDRPSEDLDARSASLNSFLDRQGPRNPFMFDPDGVEDTTLTHAQEAEQRSNAPPKAIAYTATRFSTFDPNAESQVPPSPSISAVDAAISGRPRATASESGYAGAETPRVNGYAFVDAEPSPSEIGVPVTDEEADAAEREAFDKFLPKAEEGGPNPFNIAERSKREALHHRLVEKSDVARRKGGRVDDLKKLGVTPGRTPTPRFATAPNRQPGQMTPAGRQLAAKLATPKRGW